MSVKSPGISRSQLHLILISVGIYIIPSMSLLNLVHNVRRRAFSMVTKDSLKIGQELSLSIHDLTNLGLGVGRKELSDGSNWIIMVPLVLPGEEVMVRIGKNNSSYSEAELVRVIKPSPDRVIPKCTYFSICGGCQYQHMSYDSQKKWKHNQVKTALERIGRIEHPVVNPIVAPADPYGYRSKLTPAYEEVVTTENIKELKIGFKMRATHHVVDVDRCAIASDRVNEGFASMRQMLQNDGERDRNKKNKKLKNNRTFIGSSSNNGRNHNGIHRSKNKTLLLRDNGEGLVETDGNNPVSVTVNGIKFQQRAKDFFQSNAQAVPYLVDHVITHAVGDDCHHLVDTYCGCGLFALCSASRFKSVHGIEISTHAASAAANNAAINNITNAHFTSGKAENIFKTISKDNNMKYPSANTVVVVDPPRAGCDRVFLDQLLEYRPKKIVYVSCDPATQARDARILLDGGYEIRDVTPFDMFPQTRHMENVIVFIEKCA